MLPLGVGESNGERRSNREIKVARAVLRRGTTTNLLPFSTKCGWWLKGSAGRARLTGVGGSGLLSVTRGRLPSVSVDVSDCDSFVQVGPLLNSGEGIRFSARACCELRLRLRRAL